MPIYADATRVLLKHFDLIENLETTPAGQPVKSYLAGRSRLANIFSSVWVSAHVYPAYDNARIQCLSVTITYFFCYRVDHSSTLNTSANKEIFLNLEVNSSSHQVRLFHGAFVVSNGPVQLSRSQMGNAYLHIACDTPRTVCVSLQYPLNRQLIWL